jgi:hypothetical protein
MDSVIKNYEEVLEKPVSTRIFLKFLKHKFDVKRASKKNVIKQEKQIQNSPPEGIETCSFAIVVDNVVVDIMHVQKEFGDILKNNPEFVFINKGEHNPHIGWIYQDGSFVSFDDVLRSTHVTMRG